MDTTSTPNRPVATYRDGALKATVWRNQGRDGAEFYSVALARTYEDRGGKLQETNSFAEVDIPRLKDLATEARTHALHLKREQNQERRTEQTRSAASQEERQPARFQDRAEPGMDR